MRIVERVFSVHRQTKTKGEHVGDFKNLIEAEQAMVQHYTVSPKRGKIEYVIAEEDIEEIGGVLYRAFTVSKNRFYKCYSAAKVKEMCT